MKTHIFKDPDKYKKNNSLQYNFAMDLIKNISFYDKSRILDIGCGDGIITNEIAKIVNNGCVIGTDISHEMISHASKEYSTQDNLRFLQMDATKNIFNNQFDIIISFNCLHWVQEQQKALDGIANAATPGAQIALLLSHKKSAYHHALDEICLSPKWKSFFINFSSPRFFFTLDEYKNMVLKAKLNIVEIEEKEMTYNFDSSEKFQDFFYAAGAHIKQIPENRKLEFLNDFSKAIMEKSNCKKDNIPVCFWCIKVIAVKPFELSKENIEQSLILI